MLLVVTVETNRKKNTDIGDRLINAEYWHAARTVESSKTQFFYPLQYRDRRESPSLLKTTDGIATIRAAANVKPADFAVTLPVHPDDDTSKATVDHDFRTEDIVWGIALKSDPTNKSTVWILSGGFKVNQYVVDLTLAEIVALVAT